MVAKEPNVPVSYLNKSQKYKITLVDPAPLMRNSDFIQYRTFVRISFDDEEQRTNPVACWQLWKENQGLRDLRQRGETVLAVECVGQHQEGSDGHGQRQIQVEQKSFEGSVLPGLPHEPLEHRNAVFLYVSIFCRPISPGQRE